MPYIKPLERADLSALEPTFQGTEGFLGFLPNDVLTMAYLPGATEKFMDFCLALYQEASLPSELLLMVGMMASSASGCRYCTAHNAGKLNKSGADSDKVARIWEFETSELYTDAERVALRFAMAAGQVPNLVEQAHYDALREHFTEKEIVEILFVICQFGFWNRWNDSAGTTLEHEPREFSEAVLPDKHWSLGKHS
ncbi:MAG: carboxymuconolactone decarboxylase family protein [Pseudomonadota bacterium]